MFDPVVLKVALCQSDDCKNDTLAKIRWEYTLKEAITNNTNMPISPHLRKNGRWKSFRQSLWLLPVGIGSINAQAAVQRSGGWRAPQHPLYNNQAELIGRCYHRLWDSWRDIFLATA